MSVSVRRGIDHRPVDAADPFAIETAAAWFDYHDTTKGQSSERYAEIEPWAWTKLQQRLRAIRARRRAAQKREAV
jgi:hypothetical protein